MWNYWINDLYDYSEINNCELGIYFERANDLPLWDSTINELDIIIDSGKVIKETNDMKNCHVDDEKIELILNGNDKFKIEDYPIKDMDVTTRYGFVTYSFERKIRHLKKMKQENFPLFKSSLGGEYRVYWESPFNRICIYDANNIIFTSDDDLLEYRKKGINKANEIIRKHIK